MLFRGITLAVILMLTACGVGRSHVQFIVVDVYPDQDSNKQLVMDLLYYDHGYLANNIPALKRVAGKGVSLGYFIRASDGETMYKIEYDLTSPAVANNLESLTAGFRRFIPQLAKHHLEKDALFSELAAEGRVWLQSLYTGPADAVLSSSAIDLREATTPEKMADYQKQLAAESGAPTAINLVRAQYYKNGGHTGFGGASVFTGI